MTPVTSTVKTLCDWTRAFTYIVALCVFLACVMHCESSEAARRRGAQDCDFSTAAQSDSVNFNIGKLNSVVLPADGVTPIQTQFASVCYGDAYWTQRQDTAENNPACFFDPLNSPTLWTLNGTTDEWCKNHEISRWRIPFTLTSMDPGNPLVLDMVVFSDECGHADIDCDWLYDPVTQEGMISVFGNGPDPLLNNYNLPPYITADVIVHGGAGRLDWAPGDGTTWVYTQSPEWQVRAGDFPCTNPDGTHNFSGGDCDTTGANRNAYPRWCEDASECDLEAAESPAWPGVAVDRSHAGDGVWFPTKKTGGIPRVRRGGSLVFVDAP